MNAYSEDLRNKFVGPLRRGMTKSEAARTFSVSRPSVKSYAKLVEEGRPLAPKKRPGSKLKMFMALHHGPGVVKQVRLGRRISPGGSLWVAWVVRVSSQAAHNVTRSLRINTLSRQSQR